MYSQSGLSNSPTKTQAKQAAIAAAAVQVAGAHGADAVMLVLAADHLIYDQGAFGEAVAEAAAGADAAEYWLTLSSSYVH